MWDLYGDSKLTNNFVQSPVYKSKREHDEEIGIKIRKLGDHLEGYWQFVGSNVAQSDPNDDFSSKWYYEGQTKEEREAIWERTDFDVRQEDYSCECHMPNDPKSETVTSFAGEGFPSVKEVVADVIESYLR